MPDLHKLYETACFLFDMDGTIYLGDKLLPGARELVDYLNETGKPYYFLTNNSSKSRQDYVEKLGRFGLPIPAEHIFSSGEATAIYLNKHYSGAAVYLVGTPSLEIEFKRHDIRLVQDKPDVAVLGFDTTLTYKKLWNLCEYVREGLPFIATHPDINCPTETGYMPDIGAMLALVTTSTGREPDVIVGKPFVPIIEAIIEKTGFSAEKLTMVGDRLYTDIAMGQAGISTVLVLSGEAKKGDIPVAPHKPDFVIEDVAELLGLLQAE
ncbi:MAG: HAD-IIA family hydrolase [Chloroflexi bacterium]|nr:MAG: HAD-IIA family hydrolase [Chloroflexota bacterium]MBL1195472.1 HAD-IIA family hydrolase [Chloroflexota bacterium]NOH12754.1 HAD-IIA family hydrolase [Chloroflexota bacterium]